VTCSETWFSARVDETLLMNGKDTEATQHVKGRVKWFDPVKGFGFIADDAGEADVLLHGNVLRNFGQSSVIEGAVIEVTAVKTARGRQALEVLSVAAAQSESGAPIAELESLAEDDLAALPLLPARVKWFDRNKGFGFANIFGRQGDVFLHLQVLRRGGLADLLPGEAVGLRVFTAPHGMIAAQITAWERPAIDSLRQSGDRSDTKVVNPLRMISDRKPRVSPPSRAACG